MKSDKSRKRFVFLCVAPATILFFIFMILPTLNVFRMSLYERGAYSPNETFVGLKNFQHLLRDAQFIRSMQNMILLVVTVTLITFAFALVFAAILTREKISNRSKPSVRPIRYTAGRMGWPNGESLHPFPPYRRLQ